MPDNRPVSHDIQEIRMIADPQDVTIYQARTYMAVCVVRDDGTPEWRVSKWTAEGLVEVPADEAEEVALELLP